MIKTIKHRAYMPQKSGIYLERDDSGKLMQVTALLCIRGYFDKVFKSEISGQKETFRPLYWTTLVYRPKATRGKGMKAVNLWAGIDPVTIEFSTLTVRNGGGQFELDDTGELLWYTSHAMAMKEFEAA